MEQLIYTIDSKDYLLMKPMLTAKNQKEFKRLISVYSCIVQGTGKFEKNTFWNDGYAFINVLVPCNYAKIFSDKMMEES